MESEDQLRQIFDECQNMLTNLRCINLETWAVQSEILSMICQQRSANALVNFHESLQVRLISAMN
jgi:hypothetical protein